LHTSAGDQSLLMESLPNTQRPSTGGPYHWTTNQNWWVSCLPATANTLVGETVGEAYLAIAPDGTKYTFNWLSKRIINSVSDYEPEVMQSQRPAYLFRVEYQMLPTRIEDRFGNWVKYTWSNDEFARLQSISSGPVGTTVAEQAITLAYNAYGSITSASDGTRTWTYDYTAGLKVTLPDGTFWQYSMGGSPASDEVLPVCTIDEMVDHNTPEWRWACYAGGESPGARTNAVVIHPSGARIDFTFDLIYQYSPTSMGVYAMGITDKTISGPGLAPATWKYGYLMTKDAARAACFGFGCPIRIMTDQINPDSSVIRRIFGARLNIDETVLLGQFEGSLTPNSGGSRAITFSDRWGTDPLDDPTPIDGTVPTWYKELDYRQAPGDTSPYYTVRVGINPLTAAILPSQTYASERRLPTVTRNLVQQDVTFTTQTNAFDAFARPASVTRSNVGSSGGNASRIETTTYYDDSAHWVLGQVATVIDGATGALMSKTDYDATTALPIRSYGFGGLLQQTLTYNADGTLATAKDGLNHVTTLSSWYRGIPRTIAYPSGFNQYATVSPQGNVLSTTNELASVTSYGYDTLGRLNAITYPGGDTVAWNPLSSSFIPVALAEYGIPAGHWKQTVQTGNGRATTFYDARWNPVLTLTEDTALTSSKSFVVRRFDAMGREVFSSYPVAAANVGDALPGIVTEYDALSRAVKTKQDSELSVLTSTTEYLTGFQSRVTNPRGFQTSTKYQVFDAPNSDAPVQIDAPQGVSTTIIRDTFGRPLSVTRSGPGS
ncbi:MAG: hypothetical protein LH616_01175, partial [Ilumatobacteraceae bacterium]|nr:hypothetical protein [Ilumatobacteraceae bacterium]